MAISGPRYLVVETTFAGDGRWSRDLAPKPNCYLSEELAAARVRELAERAGARGGERSFQIQCSLGGALIAAEGARARAAA